MATPSELTSKLPQGLGWRKLLSTRRGTALVAGASAVVALAVLLVFMSNYRDSVSGGGTEMTVLVADKAIDQGTSGDVIAENQLFGTTRIRSDEASDGVITDPATLKGQVATTEIYSGQQLTTADFASGADPIAGKLEGEQRAISVPFDAAHGNIGQIKAGSKVDVLGGLAAADAHAVLARDVLVLRAPESANTGGVGGTDTQDVVLRVTDVQASRIAFYADLAGSGSSSNEGVWLTVRPPTLAKNSPALDRAPFTSTQNGG